MTGLAGARSVIPAKPRPSTTGKSPARKAFRSIPALKFPPAPVTISTRTSPRASSSSVARAMPRATSPLTAFLLSGRLIVMTAMPSSTVMRIASAIVTSLRLAPEVALRSRGRPAWPRALAPLTWAGTWQRSLGLEPDVAVEADDLGIDVVVLDQRPDQVAELLSGAHPLGEDDRRGEPGLELVTGRPGAVDRRVDDARADGVHPDTDGGKVPGGGHGHADDPALGSRVGNLAGLALQAGHRRGVDDDPALPVGVGRVGLGDRGGGDPHQVEGADQVDVDHLAVGGQVVRRPVAGHGAGRPADSGAAHGHPQRPAQRD